MTDEAMTLRTVESIARMEARIAEITARATAAEARVAELLSDRADAAGVLVTEVERAQTAERRAAELTRERDEAIVRAVDAVRADYAPRREPPTADEVRALARLWGVVGDDPYQHWIATFVSAGTPITTTVFVALDSRGNTDCRRSYQGHDFNTERPIMWEARSPTGPVAWSELAALVQGGDRG